MSAGTGPTDPSRPNEPPGPTDPARPAELSAATERARERLHEEIERVRLGVEEMMAEQGGSQNLDLRRELDLIREENRRYVKRRVRKAERRFERSLGQVEGRIGELERRLAAFEQERRYAEWRIHTSTEQMLDGLLREVRWIADRLTRMP
jgi:hypothetical protein